MVRQGKWAELAAEVSDEVVHLFAAVGRWDEIAGAIERRFGGLSDAINARANPEVPDHLPPDLIQDIRRLACPFTGFAPL